MSSDGKCQRPASKKRKAAGGAAQTCQKAKAITRDSTFKGAEVEAEAGAGAGAGAGTGAGEDKRGREGTGGGDGEGNESVALRNPDDDPAIRGLASKLNVNFEQLREAWLEESRNISGKNAKTVKRRKHSRKQKWIKEQMSNEKWLRARFPAGSKTKAVMSLLAYNARTSGALASECSKLNERVCVLRKGQAGIGIACTQNLQASVFLAEYVGEIKTIEEVKSWPRERQTHLCTITGTGQVIDGIKHPEQLPFLRHPSFASFANHSSDPNCYLCVIETINRVFLVTRKPISRGEELTVDYGKTCFEMMHRPP